jgi:hypothetical protein
MIRMQISPSDVEKFRRQLALYERTCGKTQDEVMRQVGKLAAGECAMLTQPYGVDQATGNKFIGSIWMQILRAALASIGVFSIKTPEGAKAAHNRFRNSRGVVPARKLDVKRNFTDAELTNMQDYAAKQAAKAGRMKSAWIVAGNQLKTTQRLRVGKTAVGKWIKRHLSDSSHGSASIVGRYPNVQIHLTNKTTYLEKRHINLHKVEEGIQRGTRRVLNMMRRAIRSQLKKTI